MDVENMSLKQNLDYLKGLVEHVERFQKYVKSETTDELVDIMDRIESERLMKYAEKQLNSYKSEKKQLITVGHEKIQERFYR